MTNIWFNQGYSSVRDALIMISEAKDRTVRLLASHHDVGSPVLRAADMAFLEPGFDRSTEAGAGEYVDYCLEICRIHQVDLFVAQSGSMTLAGHKKDFAAIGTRLAVPGSAETLALLHDKARFYEVATAAGLPMPWTREIHDVEGFDAALKALDALGLDACVKPPQGVFGAGFWRLDAVHPLFETLMNPDSHRISPAALRAAIATAPPGLRLLVLEHLSGVEWSVDCVCEDGRLVVGVGRRKIGRAQRIETDGPVFEVVRHAIASFGLSGLINVQCKAAGADDGDVRLLEINARMSGGCLYTRYSGVNLPWWHVALELGLAREDQIPAPVGGALVAPLADALQIQAPAIGYGAAQCAS